MRDESILSKAAAMIKKSKMPLIIGGIIIMSFVHASFENGLGLRFNGLAAVILTACVITIIAISNALGGKIHNKVLLYFVRVFVITALSYFIVYAITYYYRNSGDLRAILVEVVMQEVGIVPLVSRSSSLYLPLSYGIPVLPAPYALITSITAVMECDADDSELTQRILQHMWILGCVLFIILILAGLKMGEIIN